MTPTPTPIPTPAHRPAPAGLSDIVHTVLRGVWQGLTSHPLVFAFVSLAVLVSLTRSFRAAINPKIANGDERLFQGADRRVIFARAGGRCEQHEFLIGRCKRPATEADHIHPWSRGGATLLSNGQALCTRHNRAKSAKVPWEFQLRALEKRRATYFPPGTPVDVVRRRPSPRRSRATAERSRRRSRFV